MATSGPGESSSKQKTLEFQYFHQTFTALKVLPLIFH